MSEAKDQMSEVRGGPKSEGRGKERWMRDERLIHIFLCRLSSVVCRLFSIVHRSMARHAAQAPALRERRLFQPSRFTGPVFSSDRAGISFLGYVKKIKSPRHSAIRTAPDGNALRSRETSIISPATSDPVSIPMLWAMARSPMTDPMASLAFPFKTASAIRAGIEMPPPRPNNMQAITRSLKLFAHSKEKIAYVIIKPPETIIVFRFTRSATSPMGTWSRPLDRTPNVTRIPMDELESENSTSAKTGKKLQMTPIHAA